MPKLLIKIDVDTYKGTKEGLEPLCKVFEKHSMPALFLFSFGPDNTGKALRKIFRKGFLKKCLRSNVTGNYGIKTLLYGTLLPAPIIYKKCRNEILDVKKRGFACGIHSWDHFNWQENLLGMSYEETKKDFESAQKAYKELFNEDAICCGAAGWQCSKNALLLQDESKLLFASDARGYSPFLPKINGEDFFTLQIPSTLPTLDELLGTMSLEEITNEYMRLITKRELSVMTTHAELEGLAYIDWLDELLGKLKSKDVVFDSFENVANNLLQDKAKIRRYEIAMSNFPNRSGLIAVQKL